MNNLVATAQTIQSLQSARLHQQISSYQHHRDVVADRGIGQQYHDVQQGLGEFSARDQRARQQGKRGQICSRKSFACAWRNPNYHLNTEIKAVLFRAATFPTLLLIEHESIPANLSLGQPTVVSDSSFSFYVAYRNGLDNKVWMLRHSGNGWSTDEKARQRVDDPQNPGGPQIIQDLPRMHIENSPHIDFTYLPAPLKTGTRHIYGFFADNISTIHVYRYDVIEKLWTKVDPWERNAQNPIQQPMNTRGRPTTAWVPLSSIADWPGRLYLMWRANSNAPQMACTHTIGITPAAQNHFLGMASNFDNSSTRVSGLGLYFENKHDSNLRLLSSQGAKPIIFRPKADGISDYNLEDQSDWFTFSVTTCRNLMYPYASDQSTIDPELTNPIHCLPWPWGLP